MQCEYTLAEKVALQALIQRRDLAQKEIDAVILDILERIPVPEGKILSSGGLVWGDNAVSGDDAIVFVAKPDEKPAKRK